MLNRDTCFAFLIVLRVGQNLYAQAGSFVLLTLQRGQWGSTCLMVRESVPAAAERWQRLRGWSNAVVLDELLAVLLVRACLDHAPWKSVVRKLGQPLRFPTPASWSKKLTASANKYFLTCSCT